MSPLSMVNLKDIIPFKNHPFQVNQDTAMLELMTSIKENGLLVSLVVRKITDEKYELISGHRRKMALEMLGINKIEVDVREFTDNEAIIYMVDSNIYRDKILPSEKAFAYKMKFDAMKHQGKLTSVPGEPKLPVGKIGNSNGDSAATVKRYIRLTYLIPEILELVENSVKYDKKLYLTMGIKPAVELSYLNIDEQKFEAKGLKIRECDGFFDIMVMGEKPQRTCMSYIDGAYNSCLLSNFDSNKHIIYAYKNDQIVGRALLRVSKGCFGNVNSEKESLTFVDLTNEQEREEKLNEKLTLFLERAYFANVGSEEIDQISKLFIELAERKALELSSRLIISTSYRGVAKEYIEAQYYFYISRSKGGEQYFDSLSGRASVSDEQSYRRNRFLISKESLKG